LGTWGRDFGVGERFGCEIMVLCWPVGEGFSCEIVVGGSMYVLVLRVYILRRSGGYCRCRDNVGVNGKE
jgi:hypothetical protein